MMLTRQRPPAAAPGELARLAAAAAGGDQGAWESIVDRFANLVWAVARSYRLNDADAADVTQATWLRLVQHLPRLREPACLGAWLATTTRREALRLLRRTGRDLPVGDAQEIAGPAGADPPPEQRWIQAEQRAEVRAAFETLPGRCRQLLRVLLADPPPSYQEAAAAVGMPVGSVGPTRVRCLEVLRRVLEDPSGGRPRRAAWSRPQGRPAVDLGAAGPAGPAPPRRTLGSDEEVHHEQSGAAEDRGRHRRG